MSGNRRENGTSLGARTIVAEIGVTKQAYAPRRPLTQPDDLIEDRLDLAQRGTQAVDQLFASLRRRHAPCGARKETDAEALLEPADRMTERGPRNAQPFRCLRKAPLFSNGQERGQHVQVVELHW